MATRAEVRFVANPRAVEQLLHDEGMRRMISRVGVAAKREVAARAPRRTGKLAKSVRYKLVETPDGWVASVNFGRFYGRFYEFGTSKTPARPFLRPGVRAAITRFNGRIG